MTTFGYGDPLHAAVDARLAEIMKTSPAAEWHKAWTFLGPDSSRDERLSVHQAGWDAGYLPLVSGQVARHREGPATLAATS